MPASAVTPNDSYTEPGRCDVRVHDPLGISLVQVGGHHEEPEDGRSDDGQQTDDPQDARLHQSSSRKP